MKINQQKDNHIRSILDIDMLCKTICLTKCQTTKMSTIEWTSLITKKILLVKIRNRNKILDNLQNMVSSLDNT